MNDKKYFLLYIRWRLIIFSVVFLLLFVFNPNIFLMIWYILMILNECSDYLFNEGKWKEIYLTSKKLSASKKKRRLQYKQATSPICCPQHNLTPLVVKDKYGIISLHCPKCNYIDIFIPRDVYMITEEELKKWEKSKKLKNY